MGLEKFEIWVHDHILKNERIRHACYGLYQRVFYAISPKIEYEGEIHQITPDDDYEYLFGYYDKCPWSPDEKHILSLRVKNAHKQADSKEEASIISIDVRTKEMELLAVTRCWNVQQGCMAQWLDDDTIIYNDFRDGHYCSIVLNLRTKEERIIKMPIYALSNDKKTALTLDFSRLHRLRPGYGYANISEETGKEKCPDKTCIWKIDVISGEITPLLKYTDFANFEMRPEMVDAEHKVNHLMISPNGTRFMVLHRWFKDKVKYTRLVTCNIDGSDMYNLSDDDFVSHCCWKNNAEILSYLNKRDGGKGYYLMKDHSKEFYKMWPELVMDGHPTYSYDGTCVTTDTYPDRKRIQSIYVMNGNRIKRIARVFSPFKYGGDTRCDLHPRWSKDGKQICFDASFKGKRSICIVGVPDSITKKRTVGEITDPPKVSVIIPCYNCEKLVGETLESMEAQTYKNFEVVCVNDGSTDNTLQLLNEWKKKNTLSIRIIDQPNGGVSKARNHGIKESRGEYILFCDSDDLYHEEFIERLVTGIEKSSADAAYCLLNRNREKVMCANLPQIDGGVQRHTQSEAMSDLLYKMGDISFDCYLYKNELLKTKDILFDENTKFGEDREFNWKYLCHCKSVAFIDAPLYWYRVNNESATKKKATWRKTDLLIAVKRIEKYLEEENCVFSKEFNSYMYARAMWAVAKTFAISNDRTLFNRLKEEYDVIRCMKTTLHDKNKLVSIASLAYLISPHLFFALIKIGK